MNIVNNTELDAGIKIQDWRHCNVCSNLSGDLQVVMVSNDIFQQSKVVRYDFGLTETQCIQYGDEDVLVYIHQVVALNTSVRTGT